MLRLSKQATEEIQRLEESRNRNLRLESEKRREIDNMASLEFWEATARHWQQRAKFLENRLQSEHNTSVQAVTEMEIQSIERAHWKRTAEQNHGDVMAAESRTDSMGDILDALARGWIMETFEGCAKWWRLDTDTLKNIARDAREWEREQDSKALPLFAAQAEQDGESWIVWEWGHKPADVAETDTVEIETVAKVRNVLEASVTDWEQVTRYRVIRPNPIATASPVADAGAVMAEVGEAVAQADGFNGHMIGTDGDRVGFLYHAAKYGFKSDYNPENATSAQIEDDYSRAFAYMVNHNYPLKPE